MRHARLLSGSLEAVRKSLNRYYSMFTLLHLSLARSLHGHARGIMHHADELAG